jgi:hypothetical protein
VGGGGGDPGVPMFFIYFILKGQESLATLPPFGPKERHKWFFQSSSQ